MYKFWSNKGDLVMIYKEKNTYLLVILILAGIILGGLLGDIIGQASREFEFLKYGTEFGLTEPFVLNLKILKLSLGFVVRINIASVIGMLAGVFIYNKM